MNPRLTAPSEILHAALDKEASARDFYGELAETCHVDYVKELLLRLHNEEEKHYELIRKMLARLETGLPPA